MPKVHEIVKEIFQKDPNRGVNPDEVVAMGAAIQGKWSFVCNHLSLLQNLNLLEKTEYIPGLLKSTVSMNALSPPLSLLV